MQNFARLNDLQLASSASRVTRRDVGRVQGSEGSGSRSVWLSITVHPCGRWSLPRLLPRFLSLFSPLFPNLIHNLLLSSSPRVTPNLPNVGTMASPLSSLFPSSFSCLRYLFHGMPFSVFRTGSLSFPGANVSIALDPLRAILEEA